MCSNAVVATSKSVVQWSASSARLRPGVVYCLVVDLRNILFLPQSLCNGICFLIVSIARATRTWHRFHDNPDRMIWVQPAPWSRCCVLG